MVATYICTISTQKKPRQTLYSGRNNVQVCSDKDTGRRVHVQRGSNSVISRLHPCKMGSILKGKNLHLCNPHDRDTRRSGVRSAMRAASQLPGRGPTVVDMAPVPAR